MALGIAAEHRIPVMNLAAMTPRAACERLLATIGYCNCPGHPTVPRCAVPKNRWHGGVPLVLPELLPSDTSQPLFPIKLHV